ncbi:MAG: M24 family metallopeptidase [Erysipelotrichales bacterium]|nr:MAG: M24 family metallopeptidase [Erysipelotrichales bacterium]
MELNMYVTRREHVFATMDEQSCAVFFAGEAVKRSSDATYPFSVNRNFFYLTGLDENGLILLMVKTSQGVKEILYIHKTDEVHEKWVGRTMRDEQATQISGIKLVETIPQFEHNFSRGIYFNTLNTVYIDAERYDVEARPFEGENFAKRVKDLYPGLNVVNLNMTINRMRSLKSPAEVAQLKKAIEITRYGIEAILKNLKPGMKEYEAAAYFKFELALRNARESFDTIAASGPEARILHYVRNDRTIQDGDLILFDLGAEYGHYCADISRTFPASGKFTPRQKELYNIVLLAQKRVIEAVKPGVTLQSLNEIVKETYRVEAVKAKVIEKPEQIDEIYYHGVSHLLGLDTHDVGQVEAMVLKPGHVITVEPGLYSAKEGVGIRIEDNVRVTEQGYEVLSPDILKEIDEIEAFMSR